eukprot:COSAG05_NODE_2510_length_2968_cov_4.077727_1_plen_44_part_10
MLGVVQVFGILDAQTAMPCQTPAGQAEIRKMGATGLGGMVQQVR